ncbi:MAG: hypothetical protein R3282_09570 [Rhodothermales bacterium]|nr:hypothetical protein [Rhodothermales bacterium]
MSRTKVFVTVPIAAKEGICNHVAETLITLREDPRYAVNIEFPCAQPSEMARSIGLKMFLESKHDHWLTIDSDNPPACNPLDLVEHLGDEKPIIGLPTPVHRHDSSGVLHLPWNVYTRVGDLKYKSIHPPKEDEGWQEVDAVGTGCVLMRGSIFDNGAMCFMPFQRIWNDDGTADLGSDLAFCQRAKRFGYRVWVNWEYTCNHFGPANYSEIQEYGRRMFMAGYASAERRMAKQCET